MDKKKLKVFGFIFARGGSKGVPQKNIKILAGKPLITYAIEAAQQSDLIDRIMVSTDDQAIMDVASKAGAQIPFVRPGKLARDDSPEWLSWQHAMMHLKEKDDLPDIFVSIPTTAPLRQVKDIDACVLQLIENEQADAVITICEAQRHPSFNMVVMDENYYAKIAVPEPLGIHRRQDVSKMYDITTVAYAARPDFILNAGGLFEGRIKTVVVPRQRALDIDTVFDFKMAELLIVDQKNMQRKV